MAWFLIRIREDPSDILSDVYVYFQPDDLFTASLDFAIGQQLIIAHLRYEVERVLIIVEVLFCHWSLLRIEFSVLLHPYQQLCSRMTSILHNE
jgi:hypothetical protein